MNSTDTLIALKNKFHAKVKAHRVAAALCHNNPDQLTRHLCMWKYNMHIFMMLHVFIQRRLYASIEQEPLRCAS